MRILATVLAVAASEPNSKFPSHEVAQNGSNSVRDSPSAKAAVQPHLVPALPFLVVSSYSPDTGLITLEIALELAVQLFAFLVALYIWNRRIYPVKPQVEAFVDTLERGNFESSLLGCFGQTETCILGIVAPLPRLMDSYVTADVMERRDAPVIASFVFMSLFILPCLPLTLGAYMPYKRARVRQVLGGRQSYIIDDILACTVCFWCHICQMARDVDNTAGYTTTITCEVRKLGEDEDAPIVRLRLACPDLR